MYITIQTINWAITGVYNCTRTAYKELSQDTSKVHKFQFAETNCETCGTGTLSKVDALGTSSSCLPYSGEIREGCWLHHSFKKHQLCGHFLF